MCLFSWIGFWIFVLYSLPVTTAQSHLIGSPQPIVALAGDDVILPCRLEPPISASSRTVEWTKPGSDPEYIHVHQDGRLVYQSQNPLYKYRTTLFVDQLINGNVSLKLFSVKTSDAGQYKCFLPSLWKEAFIQLIVEDTPFMDPSSCTPCIAISVVFGFMFILTSAFFVWKWRQNRIERKRDHKNKKEESREQLMTGSKKMEDLEKMKQKLNEELQKKEEQLKDMTQVIDTLKEILKELEKQKEQTKVQQKETEKLVEENEKKVNSVDKEVTEKEGDKTVNKAQAYLKLKKIITEDKWIQEKMKKEHQQLNVITENIMKRTFEEIHRFTERKEKVENHMEQIKKQMEETEREETQRKLHSETGGKK